MNIEMLKNTISVFSPEEKRCGNTYGDGKASKRIVKVLSEIKIDKNLLQKRMTY